MSITASLMANIMMGEIIRTRILDRTRKALARISWLGSFRARWNVLMDNRAKSCCSSAYLVRYTYTSFLTCTLNKSDIISNLNYFFLVNLCFCRRKKCFWSGFLTSRFLDTTFLTTAGKRSEASFPLATICQKMEL